MLRVPLEACRKRWFVVLRQQQNKRQLQQPISAAAQRRTFSAAVSATTSAQPPTATSNTSTKPVSLYMWGTDSQGSLHPSLLASESSSSSASLVDVPKLVDFSSSLEASAPPSDAVLQQVVCGATDTAYLYSDGSCYVSGTNAHGQLGQSHKNPVPAPMPVRLSNPDGDDAKIVQVALGPNSAAFVDEVGDLYTCGYGGSVFSGMGQLGQGHGDEVLQPTRVESLVEDGCYVQQVQIGESHTTVLTTEGEVLTTGAGSYGRLGNFDGLDRLYLEPVEMLSRGVVAIGGGKSFTLALAGSGMIYSWGRNHKGQLGTGQDFMRDMYSMQPIPEPIESEELLGRTITQMAAGYSHAAVLSSAGEVIFWGMTDVMEPTRMNELLHTNIVQIACGLDYILALDDKGLLYSVGLGRTGVLGQGSGTKRLNEAAAVPFFEEMDGVKVVGISAGWKHAACIVETS